MSLHAHLHRRYGSSKRGHARAPIYAAYHVSDVLAGAYRGKDVGERMLLTHAIGSNPHGPTPAKTLCNRIKSDQLTDLGGNYPAGSVPTCSICRERLAKIGAPVI